MNGSHPLAELEALGLVNQAYNPPTREGLESRPYPLISRGGLADKFHFRHWTTFSQTSDCEVSQMKYLGLFLVTLLLSVDCVAHSDFCQIVNAAMRALPDGGVVDETSATGAQTCLSDPFANVNVPVTLLLGRITITSSESWTIPSNVLIRGVSRTGTVVSFQPILPTNNFLLISGSNVDLGYFAVTGRDTGRFIAVNDVSNVHIHDLYVSGNSSLPTNVPMDGIYAVGSDIWIDNNILSGNGPATNPPDLQSYDIVAWRNPSRIHIRN